jgi:hypothetical protein
MNNQEQKNAIQNELRELVSEYYFDHGVNTWQIVSNKIKNPFGRFGKDNLRLLQRKKEITIDSLNRLAAFFGKQIELTNKTDFETLDLLSRKINRRNLIRGYTQRIINDEKVYPVTWPTIRDIIRENKATLKTQILLLDRFGISYEIVLV